MVQAQIKEKRSLLDWSTDDLLEMIERYSDQDSSKPDEDCGHPAKADEVSH